MKETKVVAAVIEQKGSVLATQRGYGDYKGRWEFPGGKIEEGESPEEALKREIREELGIEIEVGEYLTTVEYDYPAFHLSMECYMSRIEDGDIILKEHEASRWLNRDELLTVDWLPADIEVVLMLRNTGAIVYRDSKPVSYESNGIKYEITAFKKRGLKKQGYEKLPAAAFERFSMALQNVPGQVAMKMTEHAANKAAEKLAENAYKVVLKDGMHLAKSKSMDGAYKGLAYFNDNNKLGAHADWIPVSLDGSVVAQAPQLALGVFNAMSMVTGQYFLSQINGKLGRIENGLSDIMDYLETEKRSEIIANDMTLMNIYRNLGHIMSNEFERQSTSVELKQIKKESLANINLFYSKIISSKNKLRITSKSKAEDLSIVLEELERDIPQYWCAVRSYLNATVLGTILADMDDPAYLENIKEDMIEKVKQYNLACDSVVSSIDVFINKVKDLNKTKKLPGGVKSVAKFIPATSAIGIGIKIALVGAAEVDEYLEHSSKKKKTKAIDARDDFWAACRNLDPLEESVELISEYKRTHNSPVELLCTYDEGYIRYLDDEETE